ncbi:TetR/AcrR family transcriptional regulator [Microbacterium protaetiae]|uniref:TetR/AcrR family transcriptional regulator n=1 Tax=Microbacterium protaetiae TaxID=2509458 RepID=A0A4P6ECC4_9MICO|nr:TetR/AcrR family transcriptional regulator [Microbacterium protaetiae]QAY59882.1 TetR/AcrR family transcriptional regulator [Microbacterium protaetiae]
MGNREDLLAGARQVILEHGVAKATAREIANAAGVSLAAIGYHFGSKEQLITEALVQSLGSGIGDAMEAVVAEHASAPLLEGFAALWNRMPEIFAANREALLASMENAVRMLRSAQPESHLAAAAEHGHEGIVAPLRAARPGMSAADAEAVAKLDYVLVQSLGILWLLNPDVLPSGDELARAVAVIATTGAAPGAASPVIWGAAPGAASPAI